MLFNILFGAPPEIAAVMGRVLGRPVKYQNAPIKLFFKAASALGVPEFVMEELYWYLIDYQQNSFSIGAPTTAVQEVGGAEPEPFEDIFRRYAARAPKRSAGSMGRAVVNLARTLATPGPDPRKIAQRLELPTIRHAAQAVHSKRWVESHAVVQDRGGRN